MIDALRRAVRPVTVGAASAAVGVVIGVLLPPIELDDPFWRTFWSGPPAAGLLAVVGALIAYAAARVGAQTARRSAERAEWWQRAEWALDLARSPDRPSREIGLQALDALLREATATEADMVLAVTTSVTDAVE